MWCKTIETNKWFGTSYVWILLKCISVINQTKLHPSKHLNPIRVPVSFSFQVQRQIDKLLVSDTAGLHVLIGCDELGGLWGPVKAPLTTAVIISK